TKLDQMPFGGATVANDLVFTTTFTGEVVALSRKDGSIVWTSHLPAGSNSTLAIAGDTLLAGAGLPLRATQHPVVVAYKLAPYWFSSADRHLTSLAEYETRPAGPFPQWGIIHWVCASTQAV